MRFEPLGIEGAWLITPGIHHDDRGEFLEWHKASAMTETVGHVLNVAQANCSVSARGVVRGIHYAAVPPGQAKYVTCVAGAVRDVIVDLRTDSSTFGQWEAVLLDDVGRRSVYLSEGLGHGFCALEDGSTVVYLCSEEYNPQREHGIHPLDPTLAIDWGLSSVPRMSARDRAAPTLGQAAAEGLLPDRGANVGNQKPRAERP